MRRIQILFITCCVFFLSLLGQERRRRGKPVLIRADQTQEATENLPIVPDPKQAKEHLEIGNFYYKRDNYKAAVDRYRDAVRLNPEWPEPYERLVRALEKQKAYREAIEVCDQFALTNPSSNEVGDFRKRAERLRKTSKKEKAKESG